MTTSKGAKKVHFGRNFAMTAGGVRSMTLAAAISVVCLLLISCLGGIPEEEGDSDYAQNAVRMAIGILIPIVPAGAWTVRAAAP
jgi:hypothetical protein